MYHNDWSYLQQHVVQIFQHLQSNNFDHPSLTQPSFRTSTSTTTKKTKNNNRNKPYHIQQNYKPFKTNTPLQQAAISFCEMGNHNYRNKQQKQTLTHHPTKLETNQLPKPTGLATGSHFVLMSSNYRESVDTDMYSTCIFGIGCFYLESWFIKLPGVYTTCVVSLICSLTYNMQLLLTRTNFFIDIFFIVVEQYQLQQHDPYSTLLL